MSWCSLNVLGSFSLLEWNIFFSFPEIPFASFYLCTNYSLVAHISLRKLSWFFKLFPCACVFWNYSKCIKTACLLCLFNPHCQMKGTYVILKFPLAPLKRKKETDEVNFRNVSYLTNIILTCNQYKTYLWGMLHSFFLYSLWNPVCILHLQNVSI